MSDPLELAFNREVSLLAGKACEGSLLGQATDQTTMSAGSPARPEGKKASE